VSKGKRVSRRRRKKERGALRSEEGRTTIPNGATEEHLPFPLKKEKETIEKRRGGTFSSSLVPSRKKKKRPCCHVSHSYTIGKNGEGGGEKNQQKRERKKNDSIP